MTPRTAVAATALIALVATGCGAADDRSGGQSVATSGAAESPREDVPSALDDMTADGLPTPLVDPAEIRSGGPPPDGIPPVDDPRFLTAADVDFLADDEPVLALEIDGDARAYPVQIMIWHEIANDTVGDVPVSVTYCPLCNTAVAHDRRLDGRTLSFGTSGLLYQSSLVMYDRQTESLWSHVTGEALAGVLTGATLESFPLSTVSWRDWRRAHPDGLVLSRDTGASRDYGRNPYPGYDDVDQPPFLFDGEVDGRLAAKERVVGIALGGDALAVRQEQLLADGVLELVADGTELVVWALPGTASALEQGDVDAGRDVGATGVFERALDGRDLTFRRDGDGFTDDQTGSRWNVLGRAVDGELAGAQLTAVGHVDTFWFAWAAFWPDTTVVP